MASNNSFAITEAKKMLERSPVFMLQGLDDHLWGQDKTQYCSVHTHTYIYMHTVLSELLTSSF